MTGGSGRSCGLLLTSTYASEALVAGAGVHHLRSSGGRPVAQAVGVGAQVRTALDDLAGDRELGLGGVEARLATAPARVGRDAARLVDLVGVTLAPPVGRPLPDVAGHVVEPEAVGRE